MLLTVLLKCYCTSIYITFTFQVPGKTPENPYWASNFIGCGMLSKLPLAASNGKLIKLARLFVSVLRGRWWSDLITEELWLRSCRTSESLISCRCMILLGLLQPYFSKQSTGQMTETLCKLGHNLSLLAREVKEPRSTRPSLPTCASHLFS